MIMKYFVLLFVMFFSVGAVAQDNPYAIFGHENKVEYETNDAELLRIVSADSTSDIRTMVFDYENGIVKLLDKNDSMVDIMAIRENSTLRFIVVDPHAQNYPGMSPYNFVGNMPIRAVDPDGRDIYVLFYTVGNDRGDKMLNAAAQTRKNNIENGQFFDPSTDKVVMIPLKDVSDIQFAMNVVVSELHGQYGDTKEVGVWSHAGPDDGPLGSEKTTNYSKDGYHMSLAGWSQIDFNWTGPGASFTLYGCNTGNNFDEEGNSNRSFARKISSLSNFDGVQVAGQSSSAYPSFYTNIRVNNFARDAEHISEGVLNDYGYGSNSGDTYMVGGNNGEGESSFWFWSGSYPSANQFNVYENGSSTGSSFQSTGGGNPMR